MNAFPWGQEVHEAGDTVVTQSQLHRHRAGDTVSYYSPVWGRAERGQGARQLLISLRVS